MRTTRPFSNTVADEREMAVRYHAAFVVDPDGHRIEAVCHAPEKAMVV